MNAFDIILPFLGPVGDLLLDPTISEIMLNSEDGMASIYFERDGRISALDDVFLPEAQLRVACLHIARSVSDDISTAEPLLEATLPDGSRVAAMFPPCSASGTALTIRKFDRKRFAIQELVGIGTLTEELLSKITEAVQARLNILISGGTGSGKTTLLNAIAALIPTQDRMITIEDTAEIRLRHPNLLRFCARRQQPGNRAVTMRELVRASLRHRPDRIIVGEVRGGEAFDLLQALNTGHSGSLSTIHANSAELALSRFTNCVLEAGVELPFFALRRSIADTVNVIVHIERGRDGRRKVREVVRVAGYEATADRYIFEMVSGGQTVMKT
jgi:pilus assembly protein CpaF